jgi:hypothetical protein
VNGKVGNPDAVECVRLELRVECVIDNYRRLEPKVPSRYMLPMAALLPASLAELPGLDSTSRPG